MTKKKYKYCIGWIFVLHVLLISCSTNSKKAENAAPGDTLQTRFAQGFDLIRHGEMTEAVVYDPWHRGQVYKRYYLVRDTATAVPADGIRIRIPLPSIAINSATYIESLRLLGELSTVRGVCNADYIYSPQIRKGVQEGRIADLGDSFNLRIERLLSLSPAALMTTAYNAEDENSRRLERCGIPLIYNIEWQESTPLGRAEWIRFIAAFYDKLPLADSLFGGISERYLALRDRVQTAVDKGMRRPTLLAGQDFRGTWSMPAPGSFNAVLYQDAGALYTPPTHTGTNGTGSGSEAGSGTTGSLQTTIEAALLKYADAEVWMGVQASTYEELQNQNSRYALFAPFRLGEVYNFNGRTTPTGGSDYWESAVVHADSLLADFVKVLHPSLLPAHRLLYIRALE